MNKVPSNILFLPLLAACASAFAQLGNKKVSDYYGRPVLLSHNLNFHTGFRSLFYDVKVANGLMIEVGISYRMGIHPIQSYRFKEDYFWR
jgi:hypothetical protein